MYFLSLVVLVYLYFYHHLFVSYLRCSRKYFVHFHFNNIYKLYRSEGGGNDI